jgi:hypothetical protein
MKYVFADSANGNVANDGLQNALCGSMIGGTYTAGNRRITKGAGFFLGNQPAIGSLVYMALDAGSGDVYEVESLDVASGDYIVICATATLTTIATDAPGSGTTVTTGSTGPEQTLSAAMGDATPASGDEIYATGTFNEIFAPSGSGGQAARAALVGYETYAGDDEKMTIDGGSVRSWCMDFSSPPIQFWEFRNISMINASTDGVKGYYSPAHNRFVNCEIADCVGRGVASNSSGFTMIDCEIANCAGGGLGPVTAVHGGTISGCDTAGIVASTRSLIDGVRFWNNQTYGVQVTGSPAVTIRRCVFHEYHTSNAAAVYSTRATPHINVSEAVFFECYDNAIELSNAVAAWSINENNCFFDNGAANVGWWTGENEITTDPQFIDAENHDYRLKPGSPCIAAGRAGANIGWDQAHRVRMPAGVMSGGVM